ncbi:Potassium channel [Rhizina undulata]
MSNDPATIASSSANEAEHVLKSEIQTQKRRYQHPRKHPENGVGGEEVAEGEEEDKSKGFFQPNRWWFISTAFPLIAGTFGPLANLLSICALVEPWRVKSQSQGATIKYPGQVPDPEWLLVINALSLFSAVVANLALLLNFAHRIRYTVAQPVTVTLWYLSAFLLAAIIIAAGRNFRRDEPETEFSQSFYYGILAAGLYFIISTLLGINLYGSTIAKQYPPSFNLLTTSQRTLMLQTMTLMFYLGIGALVFSNVEDWDYTDAVYWADYTLLTVGFGTDLPLKTGLGRGLLIPFALGGIIVVGLVVNGVRGLMLERGKEKVERRAIEKERRRWVSSGRSVTMDGMGGEREFKVMRKIQSTAARRQNWGSLGISVVAVMVVWFGGAALFMVSEKWGYFTSLYFTFVSLMTIGYGDYIPTSNAGKPIFVVWSLVSVPTMTILISNMGSTVISQVKKITLVFGERKDLPYKSSIASDSEKSPKEKIRNFAERIENMEENKLGSHRFLAKLAREIKTIAGHLGDAPPRIYGFEEWTRYIRLLGEEKEWSWLSERGPMLSGMTETGWLLERLCKKLEEESKNIDRCEEGSGRGFN